MAKILVVEDDEYFREALKDFLTDSQFEVFEAPNGKAARDIMGTQKFDLVLSDVQMPYLDGIELLGWIKHNQPTPFILMTGFAHVLETQSAFDLGADEFLSKPFKNEELTAAVEKVIEKYKKPKLAIPTEENQDSEFCKVSLEEFVSKPRIDFDVFVRLSSQKYVKIGVAGDLLPKDRIESYKAKGVSHLHIKKEDFGKLVSFNLGLAKTIKGKKDIHFEKKMNFMKYTGEVILEKAFVDGVNQESLSEAKDFITTTVSVLNESEEAFNLLDMLNAHSDYIYAHSVGVAMYSVMLARVMGHTQSQTFFKLSMAGMFHDIGKKEIDREILEKPRPLLNAQERKLIESHVVRSQEILTVIKGVPSDVIQIVAEHHEDMVGTGYPRGLNKRQLHPLSLIFITADLFAQYAIKGPQNPGMPGRKAIEFLESNYGDRLDTPSINGLKAIF